PVIPARDDQPRDEDFDKATYRRRNIAERAVGWFKWCRALAFRFDKLAVNYVALWIIANIQFLLRKYPEALGVHLSETTQKEPATGSELAMTKPSISFGSIQLGVTTGPAAAAPIPEQTPFRILLMADFS